MKRFIAFFVAVLLAFPAVSASALDFPEEVWVPLDEFGKALDAGDDQSLLQYGEQIISIMEGEPDSLEKTEFLAGKYEQVSRCAERLGLYDKAVEYYQRYLPYGEAMGWTDGVLFAKKKLYLLQPYLNLFVEDKTYMPVYYGAKFEPERGVYFGSVYDNDERILDFDYDKITQYFPKKNSVYLMYLEFGQDVEQLPRYERYFDFAKEQDIAIELAWNTYQPIPDINAYDDYIKRTIDFLADSGLKIFLRFGCEMNIGSNGDDPELYIKAFQKVAEYAKTKENIATVWSPNDLGALDRPFEEYYPGNEYVDWIGCSMYLIPYFEGKKDHGSQTDPLNTYFVTGEYAAPVNRMRELQAFLKENGIEKPVMLSECGASHYVRTEQEDTTQWAMQQMRKMYTELLMEYPNIKMIQYFNVKMENEINAYELYTNQACYELYNQLVENPYLLSNTEDTAPFGYRPLDGGTIMEDATIYASGYYPKTLYHTVRYYIDGNLVQESTNPPYGYQVSGLTEGPHQLKVELYHNEEKLLEKTVDFQYQRRITVNLNGETIEFADQEPVILEDRTLVPVRGIFEKMGMEVSWEESTQKVTISGNGNQIVLKIDDPVMVTGDGTVQLEVPPQLINERTMLPLRAVAEAVSAKVDWDPESYTVSITF